jgi:transposase, IS30 family
MKYLTFEERTVIQKMLRNGASIRSIGKVVGRGHSTISEEISLNQKSYEPHYNALEAHRRFLKRQENKGNVAILQKQPAIKQYIMEQLREKQWSPEQTAGMLELLYGEKVISLETIYQFIYSAEGKQHQLWHHLRYRHHPRRKTRTGRRKQEREIIPEKVSIHERGEQRFGDLESDSMIFSLGRAVLSVQEEPLSKRCVLTKLLDKTAQSTRYALEKSIEEFGQTSVRSLTFDNGTENVKHTTIRDAYSIKTYFCDAYCSYQKGKVENTNGLIRQYLPRSVRLEDITDDEIYTIQEKLNNRPRKSLKFLTPNQVFSILAQGGRIRT